MRYLSTVFVYVAIASVVARAQEPQAPPKAQPKAGVISGVVTTQGGTVRLPGADVVVLDASGKQVGELLSEEDGHFNVVGLPQGKYKLSASLMGFVNATSTVDVVAGRSSDITLDLAVGITQTVEVVAASPVVSSEGTVAPTDTIGGKELEQLAPSGGLQASLRLLASVISVPNGVSIRGGRPSQAGLQLGPNTLVDPSTGLSKVALPDDAIESVSVLANPYAVEFGRFSSGIVVIQTRRGGDEWKARINDIDPTFRTKRGSPVDVLDVGWWAPRGEVGGPLIKDRLFLEQAAQFRYSVGDIASLPQDLVRKSKSFSSFTRLDANLSPRHTLVATTGLFPGVIDGELLGTFTPPNSTVNSHVKANEEALTERALWTDSLFGETTVHVHHYQTDSFPQGQAPMQMLPETTLGNFFNEQHRDTDTYQVVETLSGSRTGPGGSHLFKVGFDLLRNEYSGSSLSQPVLIERTDGTLARRLDFPALTTQSVNSSDVALFAQDRFQPTPRWYLEFGGRLDRDGITQHFNMTPRIGTAVVLNQSGSAVLRGGFGYFFERTPSTAGAFEQFGGDIDTRFASDGVTPLGPPVRFVNTTASLDTARSRTWDIGYDHRLNKLWAFHVGMLDRSGSHELIVNPVLQSATTGELELSSTGNSRYRGADVSVHFARAPMADVTVSYTRSAARADLNALNNYFDTILWPVVGSNAYAPAASDAPNRLLARGRLMPTPRWLVIGIFDWRNGLPYSTVDAALDYVSPRNELRFPVYHRLEVGLERRVKILKFDPWLGVRVWNALNSFLPVDVQSNVSSPAFGGFYNSEYRQIRIEVRFER